MWDRRDFLLATGAAMGSLAATGTATAAPVSTAGIVVADRRIAASRAFAAGGRRVVWIDGDVTDFWYDELDLLWRREQVALAGLTAHGAFFCLERLGMDRGLRVAFKEELPPANRDEPQRPVRWLLAPKRRPSGDFA
ncbi:MAG: hypothetical protein WDM86_03780 [Rhizomicrobium sp.]